MRVAPPIIENHSTTESAEEMQAAGRHYGIDFEVTTIKTGLATEEEASQAAEAAKDTPKPSEEGEPAEAKPKATDAEAKPKTDLETVGQTEQEDETRHKKLLRQVDKLTAKWKSEQTGRKAIETQLEALRSEIATLKSGAQPKPEVAAEPETPKRPVRPARPRMEQFDYDQARYDAATDRYEAETIPAYEDELGKWNRAESLREFQAEQERAAQEQILQQDQEEWQSAIDSRDGLREKIEAATDVMQSPAMLTVVQGIFDPQERAVIVEYLIDNPDEAARITTMTLGKEGKGKTSASEWAYLQNVATRHFTAILKDAGEKREKPEPPGPKAVERQPAPPAKPKPPVSAAPAPITPVGARTGASSPRLDDPNVDHAAYVAERQRQLAERRRGQFAR